MLYLESFQPIVPIFHVPTLDLARSHWIIPLAMASIGCQFLEMEDYGPFSSSIYEFLHRAILYEVATQTEAPEYIHVAYIDV